LTRSLERREVPEVTEVAVAAEVVVVASEVATEATAPSAEKVVTAEKVATAEKVVTAEVAAVASEVAVEAEVVPALREKPLPLPPLRNDLHCSDARMTTFKRSRSLERGLISINSFFLYTTIYIHIIPFKYDV
jgi:hypothetical protein